MSFSIQPPYLLFLGNAQSFLEIKTARGIAHWTPEKCLGEYALTEACHSLGLPSLSFEEAASKGAKTLIIGIANSGGLLNPNWIPHLQAALEAGLDIASGLHQRLTEIPALADTANRLGRSLIDIRHPQQEIAVGTGIRRPGNRILTVGTDCAVGKMYSSLALTRSLQALGFEAEFKATGQTGIFIAGKGVSVDAVVADFMSGAIEALSPANCADHWDVIEGQGSLFNPSFAGVSTALLHGAQADFLVLCHEAGRQTIKSLPHIPIPDLAECIQLNLQMARLTNPQVRLAGISLNCRNLDNETAIAEKRRLEDEFGVPCCDPVQESADKIAQSIHKQLAADQPLQQHP